MKRILILVLVTVAVLACNKGDMYDPGEDYTKLKKYVIYDTEKMKTNVGKDCPSRKKGRCISRIGNDFVKIGDEMVVSIEVKYKDKMCVAVGEDYKDDAFFVEKDWVIWDEEVLENMNLNLKEPVLIKAGKYEFYKDSYGRYALLPFSKANLKKRTVVFMDEKEWRAESFYDGYLGECNVLTGVVSKTLLLDRKFKKQRSLTLLLPYENNVQEGGDRLMEIVKTGRMIVKEDVFVKGLNVRVKKGIYRVKRVNEGVVIDLTIMPLV